MAEFTTSRLALDGCEIEMRRGGKGPPLLYLHGGSGAGQWGAFHSALARRFDVLAPSHPGFDNSDDPPWLDRVADIANFYLDLIADQGLDGVHVVGLSIGGWIAAEMSTRDTRRIGSFTFMSAGGLHIRGVPQLDIYLLSPEDRVRRTFYNAETAEAVARSMAAPERVDLLLKNQETAARIGWQPRLYDPHLRKWLHRNDRPTLVLWGADDPLFPPAYADEYERLVPHARKVVLEKCGHQPSVERPDAAAAAIMDFIETAAG